jgi:hypothetical protein
MPAFTRYTDPAMNTFKKTNMYYATDPMLRYQDPTYLGFKLFFLFDQPGSGLLSEQDLPNTAYRYLINRGYDTKAEYLLKFVQLFKKINQTTPWFFQSVEGLDEAWKHLYQEADFKPILGADKKITINCLDESIDLRITALMDLYRKACFDWPNRREIVPLNLRRFKIGIYVYEGRNINRSGTPVRYSDLPKPFSLIEGSVLDTSLYTKVKPEKKRMDNVLGKDPIEESSESSAQNSQDYINPNISRILLNFEYCEFMPDESNGVLSTLSNKEFGLKAQKIVFSYRNVSEDNIYRFHHNKSVTDFIVSTFDALALDQPDLIAGADDEYPIKGPGGILARFANQRLAELERALAPFKLPNSKRIEDALGSDDGNIYGLSLLEKAIQGFPQIAKDAARRAVAEALRAAAPVRELFNGNVYGFSAATAAGAALGGGLGAAAQIALQEVGKNASKSNNTSDSETTFGNNQGESPSLLNKSKVFGGGVFFDDFVPSKTNNKEKNPPLMDGDSIPSLSNVDGVPNGNYGEGSISLSNDNGPDSTSQGSPNGNASLSNG